MTNGNNSKPPGDVGQAIRQLPTGLYELSPTLLPPRPIARHDEVPRPGMVLYAVGLLWKDIRLVMASAVIGIAGLVILAIEQRGGESVTHSAAPTQVVHSTSPIVDAARTPARPEAPETDLAPLPLTTGAAEVPVGEPIRPRSLDDTRGGANERGADSPGANAWALGAGDPPVSKLQSAPASHMRAEKHRAEARHALRRSAIKSARRRTYYRSFWDSLFAPLSFQ
jgi:hypothetical protein